jgi:formaldehyde-activating enzyme involved in methanogenesis
MHQTLASFGSRNFGRVALGDRRRTRRLVALVDQLCRHPGGTLPDKLNQPPSLRAFYRLMNRPEATHATLMGGHTDATRQSIADAGTGSVLILHDATELDYTTKTTLLDDLGQIGQGSRFGYICHNSLAVRADTGECLGLLSQLLHHRADVPVGETVRQSRLRADRESRLWLQGVQASGPAPAGVRYIDISDSLSDTFEYLAYEVTKDRPFVLRAKENRKLVAAVAGQQYLLDAARQLPSVGSRPLKVSAAPQRSARTTTVQVAFAAVELAVPRKHLGEYAKRPLALWVVRVWERGTPAGEEPLEWILLTNVAVQHDADAQERIAWYERRPIIEELHKGMKTGCGIEKMQFEKIERLEPAIAVLSAVATTLLCLRDAARAPEAATRPATAVVDAEYVAVLSSHYGSRLGSQPSVLQFYMHVARLGGHQNRKCDGFPGWITLWRGWMKLQCMVDGYRAASKKYSPRCGQT